LRFRINGINEKDQIDQTIYTIPSDLPENAPVFYQKVRFKEHNMK
jgi:hypothetical protein